MSADRCCGCDGISNPDPAKFDSNRHYSTCPFYREQSVNDLITEVLCDVEVIDSGIANQAIQPTQTIDKTFDTWMTKVVENEITDDINLSKTINESLWRQLQEGLLNQYEYNDLEYIGGLWIKLKRSTKFYKLGSTGSKKDILLVLVELFELKQISKEMFIDSLMCL